MEDEGEKCHGRMTTKVNSTIEGAMENLSAEEETIGKLSLVSIFKVRSGIHGS